MEAKEEQVKEAREVSDSVDRDWLLQYLVTHTNIDKDFTQPITLWVGGGLISGVLVSGEKYFDTFIEEFVTRFTEEAAQGTREVLRELGARYYEKDESPDCSNTVFIHLLNAQFWSPSGSIPSGSGSGVTWRGRISQITGYSLGKIVRGEE